MKKQTFFLISVLLGVVALGFHLVGRGQLVKGQRLKAERIAAAQSQQIKYAPNPEAIRLSAGGRTFDNVGLMFTFSCLACLVVALVRHEPGWYSVPIMLLFFDIMTQMLL